ncbi:TPA: lytic transglycosylase domain-containing protein [Klebsiella oxytoca]|nr:lytic transglycosylase domain-containing protein [Klebsiella oxytoca]
MATTTIKLENGVTINFDGTPSQEDIEEAADIHGGGMLSPKDKGYQNEVLVRKAAIMNGVDPDLGSALTKQESGFNSHASSGAAYGLTQITPDTARTYGLKGSDKEIINQLNDPDTNANLGMKILSTHLQNYGDVNDALVAYNAGPGRVGQHHLPDETVKYVQSVNSMLSNRGTDKWGSSSTPDNKEWMSNPPEGSQAALINNQLRYGSTPNSEGYYIQNQIPKYDNPYNEDFTRPIPHHEEDVEQPQQQDQQLRTPDNTPIPQSVLNSANQLNQDMNTITSNQYQSRPDNRSLFERTFYPESVDSTTANVSQVQNNAYSGMRLNPLEVPRVAATAVWDTAAGTQNLGLATDAYVGGKLGLNNGTYVPIPMMSQAHPELAPQTKTGRVVSEILPYFTPGIGEESASTKVAALADKAAPILEKAYQNLLVNGSEVVGKNAIQSLPGSVSGTSTPEELENKWLLNTSIGSGLDVGLGTASNLLKPGSEARRARIKEANTNYQNRVTPEQLEMMHPYDENLGADYNSFTTQKREEVLKNNPNFSPEEFVDMVKNEPKWKFIAPDMSKYNPKESGMSPTSYWISKIGSKFEKLIPGSRFVRSELDMTGTKRGIIRKSLWDLLTYAGITHVPAFLKSAYITLPAAGLKQFVDHMHLQDMKRVSGVKVKGDNLRSEISQGIKKSIPATKRIVMSEAQGLPDYMTGKRNTLAQH